MQTYQSQCNQPKRKLAYFAKCGDGDKGEGQGVGGVAEASFPVADRKSRPGRACTQECRGKLQMRLPRTAPVFVKHSSEQNKANKFVTILPMTRAASPSHLKYENATTIAVVDRQFIRFPAFSFLRALPQPGGAHYCIRLRSW